MIESEATYQCVEERHGNGMYFYTDCCNNTMYSVKNDMMAYHGALCPRCFLNCKRTILYLRGTEEANRVTEERKKQQCQNMMNN